MGGAFVVGAVGDTPGIAFEPSGADTSLDLLSVVSELGLVEGLAAMLADDGGAGIGPSPASAPPAIARSRRDSCWLANTILSPWVPRGYHIARGYHFGYQTSLIL
jgi:hypothetical protein